MNTEIVYLSLFDSSEEISERPKIGLDMANKQVFTNFHKSLCEDAKNCRSQYFCRANTSLQNVILH